MTDTFWKNEERTDIRDARTWGYYCAPKTPESDYPLMHRHIQGEWNPQVFSHTKKCVKSHLGCSHVMRNVTA
jgi:hypothetical protein